MILSSNTKNIVDLLNDSSKFLSEKGIENARLNAEQLLRHTLDMNRVDLYLNQDRSLTQTEMSAFKRCLKRRAAREPLQYILGEAEFMSLPFVVDENVLIPRPETEILVEKTIEMCNEKFASKDRIEILEFGTGSGCISVSLAKYLENARITSLDISRDALKVAEKNAGLNGVDDRIQFINQDCTSSKIANYFPDKFDVLVSNPPYVSPTDFEDLPEEIKKYEPAVALSDNRDGLSFYRKIAELSPELIKISGFLMLELGLGQAVAVKEIFVKTSFNNINIFQDLNEIDRILFCEYE
ncbi:peptide chain release factor N(5)-glutamine methyltransferase [candidate division KSB1 bacterium]|nr:peptide chain release factor N(5)-glutamine methyltransferase [candidate division KSB1 bacterium]